MINKTFLLVNKKGFSLSAFFLKGGVTLYRCILSGFRSGMAFDSFYFDRDLSVVSLIECNDD